MPKRQNDKNGETGNGRNGRENHAKLSAERARRAACYGQLGHACEVSLDPVQHRTRLVVALVVHCHVIAGRTGEVGPDLRAVPQEEIAGAVLQMHLREVPEGVLPVVGQDEAAVEADVGVLVGVHHATRQPLPQASRPVPLEAGAARAEVDEELGGGSAIA